MSNALSTSIDVITNGAIEVLLWVTVGLIAVLAFFGRRLIKKWDNVVESHMPEQEIEKKFEEVLHDMEKCQQDIIKGYKEEINVIHKEKKLLIESVDKVHERLDRLYELLLEKGG